MPNGEYAPEMTLLAPSAGYDPLRATAGVYIEQWINQLGFPVEAELTNFNNILTAWFDEDDYDMFILGWTLGTTLFPTYVCDFFTYGQSQNAAKFNNPEFEAICEQFYASTDIDEARELSFQAQEILSTQLPNVFLFTTPQRDGYNGDALIFPYTEILNGIYGQNGMKTHVMAVQ
jgi:ABC-type transport system substrate-binding protein